VNGLQQVSWNALSALEPGAEPGFDISIDLGTGLGGGAVGAFLTTLIVGAILVAVAEEYVEAKMTEVVEEPVDSFLYGIFALLALVVLIFLMVLSVVLIIIAIPLAVIATIAWAAGASIAFLAIAERLIGREDGWLKPLLLAAGINGALALTGIGGLVSFAVGAAGFGAVLRDYL